MNGYCKKIVFSQLLFLSSIAFAKNLPFFSEDIQKCSRFVTLNFMGDVYISDQRVPLNDEIFGDVSELISKADLNIANLEGALTQSQKKEFPEAPFSLKMHKNIATILKSLPIDFVTRANNHSMDFGMVGLNDTSKALDKVAIQYMGVGESSVEACAPLEIEKNGFKIAFVSMSATYPQEAWAATNKAGICYPTLERIQIAAGKVRAKNDFVFFIFHWGEELNPVRHPYQRELAEFALQKGADAVFGHHAHIAQNIEEIKQKTVAYGLGNFVFTSLSDGSKFGLMAHTLACRSKELKLKTVFTPLYTNNFVTKYKTRPMNEKEFESALQPYLKDNLFHNSTLFYIPSADTEPKVRTLSDWVSSFAPKSPQVKK